jgi:Fe-S cluster biogenesis protein NfuA|tara:strand:- start:851 stop:1399 length:549 start_codon:yes stop_codon:yes gene_type:complete
MIQIEQTPNPNSLKFLSDQTVSAIGTEEFQKKQLNKIDNTFIKQLLNFKGVELVLLSEKFLTVKKNDLIAWDALKPMVISHLNEYFEKNKSPILSKLIKEEKKDEDEDEVVIKIKEVLDTKIRPAVAKDGGDIKFKSYKDGIVQVELQGSCSGCPSSLMTLKQGVQNLLKHYVTEVKTVEAE